MAIYPIHTPGATDPTSARSTKRRAEFARAAVFAEFRPRDARAVEQVGFVDRRPGNQPRRLDHVVAAVAEDLGHEALRHWLSQVAQAETPEQRQAALQIAREIASLAGIPFEEPFGQEAA